MEKPKLYQCPLCLMLYIGAFLLAMLTHSLFGCLAALAIMFVAHLLYEEVFLARAQRKHAIRQLARRSLTAARKSDAATGDIIRVRLTMPPLPRQMAMPSSWK